MKNQITATVTLIIFGVAIMFLNSCSSNTDTQESIVQESLEFEPFDYKEFEFEANNEKGIVEPTTQKGICSFNEATLSLSPVCSVIPTLNDVRLGRWTFTDKFYSLRQAYKLGIPIAKLDFNKNITVYVRDYMRSVLCNSTDGTTRLKYGQVIRTVIEIEDFDASAGADLASIAASGTLNRRTQSFYLYKDGFYNPQIDQIISSVSGKVFDVENYALYQNVMTQLINLLSSPATQFSVNLIGVEAQITDDKFLEEASIITYTLSRIEKGKSCIDIKKDFKKNPKAIELVERTFSALELKCDETKPTDEIKLRSKRLLQGIRLR